MRKSWQQQLEYALDLSDNILDTIREPLLVLNEKLEVVRANHAFYVVFRVNERDTAGHPVFELGNRQWDHPELHRLLESIIPENEAFEDFRIEHEFPHIGRRKMSLNARRLSQSHREMERILIAIEDITPESEKE